MTPFSKFISISPDAADVASELKRYLSDSALKNDKINKAYSWVKTETWEKMVNLYLKLWNVV